MSVFLHIAENADDLQRCFEIRRRVFVEEQSVPIELEMDEYDGAAVHFLMSTDAGETIGTARMIDRGNQAKIGRVAVLAGYRGRGYGKLIMDFVIDEARRRGYELAVLSSQTYAIPFYELLGFVAEGPEFDDAGIPHRMMRMRIGE